MADGTYFFTFNRAERHRRSLVDHLDVLRATVAQAKHHSFHSDAFVVLPDHLHAIWTLPGGCGFCEAVDVDHGWVLALPCEGRVPQRAPGAQR